MKRQYNYKDILSANLKITEKTHKKYDRGLQKYEDIINFFIKIAYSTVNSEIYKNHSNNLYNIYVLSQYYELPMRFRSCITLMEQGLYAEAFNLIRSLLENLVKIKYFYKHQTLLEPFEKKQIRISFLEMFVDIKAEDAYKIIYKHLSKYEHCNIGAQTGELNKLLLSNQTISLVPLFNPSLAGAIINNLMYIFYGYLSFATICFSYDEKLDDQNVKKWLKDQILNHKEKYPEAAKWSKAMSQIIN